LSNT